MADESQHTSSFRGFRSPNYTQVPDELFDELMVDLSGAELKVLLYIIRRTFGFKKESDTISISQMLHGIQARDGRVVDRGVGLSKKTLLQALRTLQDKAIIVTKRNRSTERGNEPSSYSLNMTGAPLGGETTPPLGEKVHQGVGEESTPSPRGKNSPIQETVLQQTAQSSNIRRTAQTVDNSEPNKNGQTATATNGSDTHIEIAPLPVSQPDSLTNGQSSTTQQDPLVTTASRRGDDIAPADRTNGLPARLDSAKRAGKAGRSHGQNKGPEQLGAILSRHSLRPEEHDARAAIHSYVKDIAQEFGDKAKLKSSVTRAYNLYGQAGRTMDAFISALFVARANVRERTESITQEPIQNRMSYFFSVLADQLGLGVPAQTASAATMPVADQSG